MSLDNLLYTLVGMGVGLAIGLALSVIRDKNDDGVTVVRVHLSSRWQRSFYIAVGVMAVFSVALASLRSEKDQAHTRQMAALARDQQQTVSKQTVCNRELIRVINANANVGAADRSATDELMSTIGSLVLATGNGREERTAQLQAAFRKYSEQKAANAAARQPYPPPNCGE